MEAQTYSTYLAAPIIILSFLLTPVSLVEANVLEDSPMPHKNVCLANDGEQVDNRHALVWLLDKFGVSAAATDYNRDLDFTHIDRVMAVFDSNHCDWPDSSDRCGGSDNRIQFQEIRDYLSLFFQTLRSESPPAGYSIKINVSNPESNFTDLEGSILVHPSAIYGTSIEGITYFEVEDYLVDAYRFMIGDDSAVQVLCKKKTETAQQTPAPSPLRGTFIVRGTTDDLKKNLTSANTKKISAATFSVVDDREGDSTEFNIKGVAGYKLDYLSDSGEDYILDFIPYFGIERKFNTGEGDDGDIDNFIFGVDAALQYRQNDYASYVADLRPQFTLASEADTKIGSMNLDVEPNWTIGGLLLPNSEFRFENIGFAPTGIARVKGGYVFDDGGKDTVDDSAAFFRVGAKAGLKLFFFTGTFLDHFVPFVDYEYLYGVAGNPDNAARVETGFRFVLPDLENLNVGFKYTNGDADETFEKVESIEAEVGVKF